MTTRTRASAFTAVAVALALTATSMTAAHAAPRTAASDAAPAAVKADKTKPKEAARVDSVKATIDWTDCSDALGRGTDCGTVALPLDYDEPKGATTTVSLIRKRAQQPARKIGSLFVNQGGPGLSSTDMALYSEYFLPAEVLNRFDVIGVDPRGTALSDNITCWRNLGEQATALRPVDTLAYPSTASQRTSYINASKAFGKACSTKGEPLASAMSTANVARDLDVLRRLVGDSRLTYLGVDYGSYLGMVYANLFPDRVRAIAIDGVLDPAAWQGRAKTANVPMTQRIASGDGAWKALREILRRCGKKGPKYCRLAQRSSDPVALFESFAKKVKTKPLEVDGLPIDYQAVIGILMEDLSDVKGWAWADEDLNDLITLQQAPATSAGRQARDTAKTRLTKRVQQLRDRQAADEARYAQVAEARGAAAFPYDNSRDAYQAVMCSDGLNPADASAWVKAGNKAEKTGRGFGQMWTWQSAPCATKTWKPQDEDAYRGTFSAATSAPVLVIGNKWDPATSYRGAYKAAKLLKNSAFVSSDSWAHTAYGTSACVDSTVRNYLLSGKASFTTKKCKGDDQPFAWKLGEGGSGPLTVGPRKGRAPVAPLIPTVLPEL